MIFHVRPRHAFIAVVCLLGLASPAIQAADRVNSEPSWTRSAPALRWKLAEVGTVPIAQVHYPEISVKRIFEVSQKNTRVGQHPQQIGIGRNAAQEGIASTPAYLHWRSLPSGGSVARVEFSSPLALALRVGLRVDRLDPRVELRFAGSDHPNHVVAITNVAKMRRLAGRDGIFWTPSTDGQSQIIEVYRPRGVREMDAQLQSPLLSHLLSNSRNTFTLAKSLGEAAACQLDTACKVQQLGPDFVQAKASTTLVQFVGSNGNTYGCSATLVADKVAGSQIPYLLTINTCDFSLYGAQPASVNTFWGYEATGCGSGVANTPIQLSGGVAVLVGTGLADVAGAGLLMRLNEPAPAGATFSGWDTAALQAGQSVVGIHHPKGDVKKVVTGKFKATSTYHGVDWHQGGHMESMSWGSGLFTPDADGYHLRGIARNGSLGCASDDTQKYGRLDLFYSYARKWLAPDEAATLDFDYVIDGRTVRFISRTDTNMYNHSWHFGDASYGSGKEPMKTYAEPGRYTVTLTVSITGEEPRHVSRVVSIEQNIRINGSQPRVRGGTTASTRPNSAKPVAGSRRQAPLRSK